MNLQRHRQTSRSVNSLREVRRDAAYRRVYPLVWWSTLLAPVILAAGVLGLMTFLRGWTAAAGLLGMGASSLFFGKFIILGGMENSQVLLTREELAAMVVFMDVMTACWFVFHLGVMQKLPFIGPRFTLLVEDGEYLLATNPWMRRAAFAGLIAFVMIPFAMTGSVGGSILARLLGLSRGVAFAGIFIGSLLGAGLIYLGGATLTAFVAHDNPAWTIGGLVILAALILLINTRYRRAKARRLQEQR